MSPKSIARARGILALMDQNERAVLRNYLQCFESRKKGHKPKTLVLLDLLEKYPDDKRLLFLLKKKGANRGCSKNAPEQADGQDADLAYS